MNNNNRRESSDNTLSLLLSQTSEQLKKYCRLLDNQERKILHAKVLKEMRENPEVNYVKSLNRIVAVIENCYKDAER